MHCIASHQRQPALHAHCFNVHWSLSLPYLLLQVRIASRAISSGVPCLQLYSQTSGSPDVLEQFAEIFTVLQVRTASTHVFMRMIVLPAALVICCSQCSRCASHATC